MKPTGEPAQPAVQATGIRKSGKQWKAKATPNKNPSLRIAFAKRIVKDKQAEATKALERQLKEERKAAEEERIGKIKAKKAAKEEKERIEQLKAKMHAKLVERRTKREKKNRPK